MRMLVSLLAVVMFAVPTAGSAQTFRGGVQGTVTDTTGAALPGVDVTATNEATGLARSAVSDAEGNYFLSELPPGAYSIKAALSGFTTQSVSGVRVEVSQNQRVVIRLAVGQLTQTVQVTAGSALVDATHNTQGDTIGGEQAARLPVNGRDFTKLLSLVPGSTADPSGINDSPGSFGLFSINGNRGRSNNYLLDGTDMNDGYRNLPAINQGGVFGTPSTILPMDAVEEFPILSGVEAEYGRNAGAIVNIVTRSGGNRVSGSAFEYFRNDALGARNYFNSEPNPKNPFRNNQFGGSVGAPLVKDRAFVFGAYEGQRENGGLPALVRVPTDQELADAIAANGGAVNPVIAGLLQRHPWPAPNREPDAAGNNLSATTPFYNNLHSIIAKIDERFRASDLLTVRYMYGTSEQGFPLALVGGGNLPGFNTVTPTNVNLLSASYTRVVSSKMLFEARAGFNRFDETFYPEDRDFDPNSIGLATVSNPRDFGLPLIRVSGFANLGANLSLPRGRVDTNTHLVGSLSYNTGRHNWKAGYEFRRTVVDGFFDAGYRGRLDFDSLTDFVGGYLSGGRQAAGDSDRVTTQNSSGLYLQDSFQAAHGLSVNYGVRWDYYGVIGAEGDRFSLFDESTATVKSTSQLYPKDWNNFSPRVSIAYDVSGDTRMVLRGGYGLYYDSFSQDFFVGQLPFNTFNPGPAYNNVQFSFSPVAQLESGQPVYTDFAATDVFTVDQKLHTPFIQTYSANVQHQIVPWAALEVGYVGSRGTDLFRYRDINQLDPTTGAAPFPDFIYINKFESSAQSHYNALQVSLRARGWHGLDTTVNYTLSKSTDTASDGQDYVPNATQPDDSTRPDREEGPSNFDQRHRFTWYFTWDIGSKSGSWLTSGWGVDGVVTLASGMPFNVNYLFEDDFNGSGEYFGRPDLVGDPWAGTNGRDKFLNLSAFAAPCTPNGDGGCDGGQHFGNVGRNAFVAPGYHNVDLSLVKRTSLGHGMALQVRLDAFNIFNHVNFANPLLPNFGVDFLQNGIDPATNRGVGYLPLTATPDVGGGNPFLGGGGPRNLQLSARLTF